MANYKLTQSGQQVQADLNLLDSNSATSGQVLMADGEGGASWGNVSSGTEVEANVTIPEGTTPSNLLNLKVGSEYFNIDKPIHFIKLTSTTLTEALRSEILSDDYFVILEYNNEYYYERNKTSNYKDFETLVNIRYEGTNNYNNVVTMTYGTTTITNNNLIIQFSIRETTAIASGNGKNVSASRINSKTTSSSTYATAGKVLTADGSGGTSWESGGSKIYKHYINLQYTDSNEDTQNMYIIIYSFDNEVINLTNIGLKLQTGNVLAFMGENNEPMIMRHNIDTQEISLYVINLYGYSTDPTSYTLAYQFLVSDIITFSDTVTLK